MDYERVRNSFFCTINKKQQQSRAREGGRGRGKGVKGVKAGGTEYMCGGADKLGRGRSR